MAIRPATVPAVISGAALNRQTVQSSDSRRRGRTRARRSVCGESLFVGLVAGMGGRSRDRSMTDRLGNARGVVVDI